MTGGETELVSGDIRNLPNRH